MRAEHTTPGTDAFRDVRRAWHQQRRARGECAKCGTRVREINPRTGFEFSICGECRHAIRLRRRRVQ